MLADERVGKQRAEHPFPPTANRSVQRQDLVRRHVGNQTRIEGVNGRHRLWNRAVPAGGSASAGLLGGWTTGPEQPVEATLNGARCTVG